MTIDRAEEGVDRTRDHLFGTLGCVVLHVAIGDSTALDRQERVDVGLGGFDAKRNKVFDRRGPCAASIDDAWNASLDANRVGTGHAG